MWSVGLVLLGILVCPLGAAAFVPINVSVHERDGLERHRWPLTVSVPFTRGALHAGAPVKVVDEHAKAMAVQVRPLVTWPDGSVRWLLLDTAVDLKAHGEHRLRVEPGTPPRAPAALHVSETDDGVQIDTGAVRFTVPRRRFAVIDDLHVQGRAQPVGGAMNAILVADEHSGEAQPPTRVAVLDKGPLRVRIEEEGTYGNGFDYVIRLEAYAGQPFVRVWHTFINRHPTPYVGLPRLGLELPLAEPFPSHYRYGVMGEPATSGQLVGSGLRLYQADNQSYAVGDTSHPGHLAGWVELAGEQTTVGLAARWLWQQYPQSVAARRERLVYNLWAPEATPAKAGVGAAKTHEFVVWAAPPKALPEGAGLGMVRPLLGVVDPVWMAHSGALPQAVAPTASTQHFTRNALGAAHRYAQRNTIERWDDCGAVQCAPGGVEHPRTGAYGMWNWGDWNFKGYQDTTKGTDSWGNLEYDTAWVLALTYAATGDADVHDELIAAARHFIDVDTIHACPARPEWVGMNHPKNPLHFAFELGGPDLGHTWTQGTLAYYYLTGDERALAAARAVADYLVERSHSFARGNPRQWGWPQIALLAVYDATGDARYRDAALVYARGGMKAHPATTSTQWKLGILADALAYTHAATGDASIRTWLEQYAAAVMKRKAGEDVRAFPAVAYVAALTGDAAMRAAARSRVDHLDLGSWGKPFGVNGRIGFRIESLLAAPPPAPAKPPPHRKPKASSK
jgi:hypothetical protein